MTNSSRTHWGRGKVVLFASIGAASGFLAAKGLIGVCGSLKDFGKFVIVTSFLVVATLTWLDPIVERILSAYDVPSSKLSKGREDFRGIVIGTTFLLVLLHKALDTEVEKDKAVAFLEICLFSFYAGSITWAWLRGARLTPPHARTWGLTAGLLVGTVASAYVGAANLFGLREVNNLPSFVQHFELWLIAILCVIVLIMSVLLGYFGGRAIDKCRGSEAARRILYVLTISSLGAYLIGLILIFILRSFVARSLISVLSPDQCRLLLAGLPYRDALRWAAPFIGWGLGLTVHREQCDDLLVPLSQGGRTVF